MDLTAGAPAGPGPAPAAGTPVLAPPSSTPDEVTLAFALSVDPQGRAMPLPPPQVLATLLCAIDAERGRAGRHAGGLRLEGLAPIYLPIVVTPSPEPGRVVVFDGAGIWHEAFQRSLLPPLDALQKALAHPPPPSERAGWLRSWAPAIAQTHGAESMAVEGALSSQLPLFADILQQSVFRIDPLAEHPGFLPTRHALDWYGQVVQQYGLAIARFDAELRTLAELRDTVARLQGATLASLEEERRQLQFVDGNRARLYAHEEMDREAEAARRSLQDQIGKELDTIRTAHAQIASAKASARVAEGQLAQARPRSPEAAAAQARIQQAAEARAQADSATAAAYARIEAIHERERQAYRVLADRFAVVEERTADGLAAHELLRTELLTAAGELTAALDAQAARRTAERHAVASQFIQAPSLTGVKVLWLPLWVATLVGEHAVRCVVFPPMRVRSAIGVGDSLKTLFGGVVLPLEPMTAGFGTALKGGVEQALTRDPWLFRHVRELVHAADTTADPDFLDRLGHGLTGLRESGWLTPEQERKCFLAGAQLIQGRPVYPSTHASGPIGPPGGTWSGASSPPA